MWLFILLVAIFTIVFHQFIKPNFEELIVTWFEVAIQILWIILFITIGQYWLIIVPIYFIWHDKLLLMLNKEYKWW